MSRYEEKEYGWRNRETDRAEGRTRGRLGKYEREEYEGGGGEENVHVVCVDDLKESRRALRFALRNVPRNHRLLLVHGNYESRIADTLTERPPIEEIRSNFLRLCKNEGVSNHHTTRHTSHSTTLTTHAWHNMHSLISTADLRVQELRLPLEPRLWRQGVLAGQEAGRQGIPTLYDHHRLIAR
jgi:hypothetical protein